MYNIIQLNDKDLSELQVIAKELGIKKADSYKKEDLVYKILDEQAIVGATKKVAADKLKEERKNEEQKKKRSRVAPTKKEDKVVSTPKSGEVNKTKEATPVKAPQPSKKEESTNKEKEAPVVEAKAENATTAPKRKVGRPRKSADAEEKKEVENVTPAAPKVVETKPVVAEKTTETKEKAAQFSYYQAWHQIRYIFYKAGSGRNNSISCSRFMPCIRFISGNYRKCS